MCAYLKKNFLICFSPLSPQAEKKEDGEHFDNHLQISVSRAFTKAKKSALCAEYPVKIAQNPIYRNGKNIFPNLLINSQKLRTWSF